MNKKKFLIILGLGILILAIVVLIFLSRPSGESTQISSLEYQPEFMSTSEKGDFGLPEDSKIQVLRRDEGGKVEVYKVIREEADVIYNPNILN